MKTNKLFVAAVATLISLSSYGQTVDEIVDKHVAALGGLDKINGVKTLVIDRTLSIGGMEIPSKSLLVVGKSIRSESTVMGNSMIQVVNGKTGWMIRPTMMGGTGEVEDMPAEMIKQQEGQMDPFGGLVDYKAKGNTVVLIGTEKLDKKDAYHLQMTTKEGQVVDEWLDTQTFLVSKVKVDVAGQQSEISMSDYKEIEGIQFANTLDISSPQGTITLLTDKVTINSSLDNSLFEKPVK